MTRRETYHEINPRRRRHVSGIAAARSIADLRLLARRRLPGFLYEYIEGGAEDELTLRRNRSALQATQFLPRALQDVSGVSTATTIFGKPSAMPLCVSPTGFAGYFWPNGDHCLAAAAAAMGIPYGQSTVSNATVGNIGATPGLRHWFQVYAWGPRSVWQRLVDRAAQAGCEAIILTVDGAVGGNREWDQRSYAAPTRLTWASKFDCALHPAWLYRFLRQGGFPNFVNLVEMLDRPDPTVFQVARWIEENHNPRLGWADVEWVRSIWSGRLIVKGILRPSDAVRCRDLGADAVIVSNHGGRQTEPTIATLEVLPHVRAAVGPEFTLFMDGGIRRGSDIAAALARGANAVTIGRAGLYGLSAGGEAGARRSLEILKSELARLMALVGVSRVDQLDHAMLAESLGAAIP